ncbi:MAG: guanylate kinase [Thermodesulfobacteriota bacterium]
MKEQGYLLIIDGPSAVGKSTIVKALKAQTRIHFDIVKRVTTRPNRETEDDCDIYEFITHDEFNRMVDEDAFIEYKCYKFGMCYGLPKKEVQKKLEGRNNLIAMINLGNIHKVKSVVQNCYGIFINAPLETIKHRLESRGTHTKAQIEERLGNASKSLKYFPNYDLVVLNENLQVEEVVDEIIENFLNFVEESELIKLSDG